jgi:hypothetical protein
VGVKCVEDPDPEAFAARVSPWRDRAPVPTVRVTPPARPAPGRLRQAIATNRELVARWRFVFAREALAGDPGSDADAFFDSRIGYDGLLWLWENDGPTTLIGASPPAGKVIRVAPGYTPPELRGCGYASAAVAGVSR